MNRLTRHKYHECSDLPALRPIFSCAACDEWRQRVNSVHFKDRCKLDRSKLSARYQCQRKKKGYGCIRVRVTYNDVALSSPHVAESVGNVAVVEANKIAIRSDKKAVTIAEATLAKSLRAKRLERSLKQRSAKILLEKENISRLQNTNAILTKKLQSKEKELLDQLELEKETISGLENTNAVLTEKFTKKEKELLDQLGGMKKKLKNSQEQVIYYKSQVNHQAVDLSDRKSMKKICKVIKMQ
jgi:hypothetical protein